MSAKLAAARSFDLQRHNVNMIIPDDQGRVCLMYRFCKKSLAASGQDDPWHPSVEKWHDLPGGRVDYPEVHPSAIIRETMEELGVTAQEGLHLSTMPNPSPNVVEGSTREIYVLTKYEGVPHNKAGHAEGHLGIEWAEPEDVPAKLGAKIDGFTSGFLIRQARAYFDHLREQSSPPPAPVMTLPHPA